MSKKKSLGHNPLAYSKFGSSSFDFITSSSEKKDEEKKNEKPNKSVVSYYLEDPLVDKIKNIAEEQGSSYSALVNSLLKACIKEEPE